MARITTANQLTMKPAVVVVVHQLNCWCYWEMGCIQYNWSTSSSASSAEKHPPILKFCRSTMMRKPSPLLNHRSWPPTLRQLDPTVSLQSRFISTTAFSNWHFVVGGRRKPSCPSCWVQIFDRPDLCSWLTNGLLEVCVLVRKYHNNMMIWNFSWGYSVKIVRFSNLRKENNGLLTEWLM